MINLVDEALERLLREHLPLGADAGDISFDPPDRAWATRISRMTVNAFLFEVARAAAMPVSRGTTRGELRQDPQPMVTLTYLVTAWASTTRDEHGLLGDLMACVLRHPTLPPALLGEVVGPVLLTVSEREGRKPGDVWSTLEGRIRPGFELEVTLPMQLTPFYPTPAAVETVVGTPVRLQGPTERAEPAADLGRPVLTRRRASGSVLVEGRPARDG